MGSHRYYLDYHIHEAHSGDAREANIQDYVNRAEMFGMKEIAFTTHLIISGPDQWVGIDPEDISNYLDDIYRAQDDTDVLLLSGLEVDYFPSRERFLGELLDEYNFDIVLGSTHYINGCDIGSRKQSEEFFSERPPSEAIDEYFSVWKMAVESQFFDVMAHPDYFRKYIHRFREPFTWKDFGSRVQNAINTLREYNVGIEVNTSGYRHGMGDSFPLKEFLEEAKKVGVKKVTIGSDCHTVDYLGYRLDYAVDKLRKAGFKTISVFRERRNNNILIKDLIDSN